MRTVEEIIQDQVDYTILQIILDLLKHQQQITETDWNNANKKLIKKYNPMEKSKRFLCEGLSIL